MKNKLFAAVAALLCSVILAGLVPVSAAENNTEPVMRSRFITRFATSGPSRRENIRIACAALDLAKFLPGESGSFNELTGERTEANGYRIAKIIEDGVYRPGVGGGVCQVSSTLYNALLLAGVTVTEAHGHSIRSSYVQPSLDAMVDFGWADLRWVNNTGAPVVLRAAARGDDLVVEVHGARIERSIFTVSEIVSEIAPPAVKIVPDNEGRYSDKVVFQGERCWLRKPIAGCVSNGYLVEKVGDVTKKTKIRSDCYLAVQGVMAEGTLKPQ